MTSTTKLLNFGAHFKFVMFDIGFLNTSHQEKKNSAPVPAVNKVFVRRHPWPYPRVVALDVILLHPLQGVDTINTSSL